MQRPRVSWNAVRNLSEFFNVARIGEIQIVSLPAKNSAIAPWRVDPEGNEGQDHDEEPSTKDSEPGTLEDKLLSINERSGCDPSLLYTVGPRPEQPKCKSGKDVRPNRQPQETQPIAPEFELSVQHQNLLS